jgi:N-acetylneuraminate synthase
VDRVVTDFTATAIEIAGRKVGPGHPCFVIAEAGVNHNGDLEMALQLVREAVQAGADAVKFQTYKTSLLVTPEASKAEYQKRTTDSAESQYAMLQRLELSPEMHREIIARCQQEGIIFLSSPFDEESVELLNALQVPAFKIPSGEITNLPLVTLVAGKGKPMIVSTGMAYLSEVETAVRAITDAGNHEYILLQCTSNYPANTKDVNLKAMHTLSAAFGAPVGYSDHTLGIEVPLAAVALGACVIEKHLTLDVKMPGPDHAASLEPDQFAAMVGGIRTVEAALGHGRKEPADSEFDTAVVARKSLVAARDIAAGEALTEKLVAIKRPGSGLPPAMRPHLLGRTAREPIKAGAVLTLDMLT